jgi:uncharacterized protein (TIGR02145 family)
MEPKESNMKTINIILGIVIVTTLSTSVYGACTWQVQMSGNRISGLGDPINSQDIVTKKYVDAKVAVIRAALKERQRLVNIVPTDTVEAVSKAPIAPTGISVAKKIELLAKIAATKEKQFTAEVVKKEKELLAKIARRILAKIAATKEKQIIVEKAATDAADAVSDAAAAAASKAKIVTYEAKARAADVAAAADAKRGADAKIIAAKASADAAAALNIASSKAATAAGKAVATASAKAAAADAKDASGKAVVIATATAADVATAAADASRAKAAFDIVLDAVDRVKIAAAKAAKGAEDAKIPAQAAQGAAAAAQGAAEAAAVEEDAKKAAEEAEAAAVDAKAAADADVAKAAADTDVAKAVTYEAKAVTDMTKVRETAKKAEDAAERVAWGAKLLLTERPAKVPLRKKSTATVNPIYPKLTAETRASLTAAKVAGKAALKTAESALESAESAVTAAGVARIKASNAAKDAKIPVRAAEAAVTAAQGAAEAAEAAKAVFYAFLRIKKIKDLNAEIEKERQAEKERIRRELIKPPGFNVINYGGKAWLDRNLGAKVAATSAYDTTPESLGWLFQWGRPADGHQLRNSPTTESCSSTDRPKYSNFILAGRRSGGSNWRTTSTNCKTDAKATYLWGGLGSEYNGVCPAGWKVPSEQDFKVLNITSSEDAFNKIKLVEAGFRLYYRGTINEWEEGFGYYWTSCVDGVRSRILAIYDVGSSIYSSLRTNGYSVRCVRDLD